MDQKPVKVQSVSRALQLLELLMHSRVPLSAMELSQQTGLNRSTVHSLIDTLIACDYVQKDASYGKYYPTAKMYALSRVYADQIPIVRLCTPIARKLAMKYNLALNFGLLSQNDALFIIKEFLPVDDQLRNSGYKLSFHASTIGKIHLAFMPNERSERLLSEQKMEPFTQYTVCDKDALRRDLEMIRRRGYATIRDEIIYGYSSIGFPVFDAEQKIVGAFSFNADTDKILALPPSFLNEGLQVSRDCSLEMGCQNPPVFLINGDLS